MRKKRPDFRWLSHVDLKVSDVSVAIRSVRCAIYDSVEHGHISDFRLPDTPERSRSARSRSRLVAAQEEENEVEWREREHERSRPELALLSLELGNWGNRSRLERVRGTSEIFNISSRDLGLKVHRLAL
jgi:hypothetical protein